MDWIIIQPSLCADLTMEGYWSFNERLARARDQYTPIDHLEILAKDDNWQIRFAVACNPITTSYILSNLFSLITNDGLCHAIASHKNAPPALLKKLSTHENSIIRQGVGGNRNTPISVLERLASDPVRVVRIAVEYNSSITDEIRMMLKLQE